MKVSKILPGDIIRGMVQLKNRPCIVLKVEKEVVMVCPLTTEEPGISKLNAKTTELLTNNRFLKDKSYYTLATFQVPVEDACNNMVGTVHKLTLEEVKRVLKENFNNILA